MENNNEVTESKEEVQALWNNALQTYLAGLKQEERARISTAGCVGQLLEQVAHLQTKYAGGSLSRCFERLSPVLQSLDGYTKCVHSFLQACTPQFVIIWGSLSFLLEVCTGATHTPARPCFGTRQPADTVCTYRSGSDMCGASSSWWRPWRASPKSYHDLRGTHPSCWGVVHPITSWNSPWSSFTQNSSACARMLSTSSSETLSVSKS